MIWTLAVVKFTVTAFLILPGWIEDIAPVFPPNFEKLKKIPDDEIANSDDWFSMYRIYLCYAMTAGFLHALISRISHVLTKPGSLRHESYMSMYAYLTCSMIMPILILSNLSVQSEKRKQIREEESDTIPYSLIEKAVVFIILSVLTLLKNLKLERGVMKRFVEDYDPELHFLPFAGWDKEESIQKFEEMKSREDSHMEFDMPDHERQMAVQQLPHYNS